MTQPRYATTTTQSSGCMANDQGVPNSRDETSEQPEGDDDRRFEGQDGNEGVSQTPACLVAHHDHLQGRSSAFAEATADRRSPGGGWSDLPARGRTRVLPYKAAARATRRRSAAVNAAVAAVHHS